MRLFDGDDSSVGTSEGLIEFPLTAHSALIGSIELRSARPLDAGELESMRAFAALASLTIHADALDHETATASRSLRESNAFKDDVLAMLGHDFRGPLTVILGYCELLAESAPEIKAEIETIFTQTQRLVRLSEDAVVLAQTQAGGFSLAREPTDLGEFVREAVRAFDPSERRITVRSGDAPVWAPIDRVRFRHVLDNVVLNALKYSDGAVEVEVRSTATEAAVAVTDRGIGIPEGDLPSVFTRFGRAGNARRKGIAGSGVGLYVANKIVHVHGGRIEVVSREGEGSTFTIVIPLVEDAHPT
ncbi:MAG: hypothetical protein JOZ38_02330 [Candidatus Eremiobacteraeota bacterium]|nr:hypothetical protein [Candidatus Eremiobacteraeota bacterium]